MPNDNPYRSPATSDHEQARYARTSSTSLFWTGMFAGAFVGATYGAAAGALCGLVAGVLSLDPVTNTDVVGQVVMLVVAGAIGGTVWGAMLGMCVGTLMGALATIGSDPLSRRLPMVCAIVSAMISTGVTAIILGAWTPDAKGLTMRALIGLLLTAVASGLGGFTLGRGLFRIKTERATDA